MSIQVKGGQAEAFKLVAGLQAIQPRHQPRKHAQSDRTPRIRSKALTPAAPPTFCACLSDLEHSDDLIDDLQEALKKL